MLPDRKRLAFLALALLLLASLGLGARPELPLGWTHGWSQPVPLVSGDRLLGYQSAVTASGTVVLVTGQTAGSDTRLTFSSYAVPEGKVRELGGIDVQGLREYVLTSAGDTAYLFTLRRESESSSEPMHFELWAIHEREQPSVTRIGEFTRAGNASDMSLAPFGSDHLALAWSGSSSGLRNINVIIVGTMGASVAEYVIDHPDTADRYPVLAGESPDSIYLTYYRDYNMYTEVVYRGLSLSRGLNPATTSLGRASPETPRPLLRVLATGTVAVFWAQPTRLPGRGQGAAIYAGEITHDGQWLKPLAPIAQLSGNVANLSVEGRQPVNLAWLSDRGGSLQGEYALLSQMREVQETGPITRGSENRFLLSLHAGDWGRLAIYAEYTQTSLNLYGVDDLRPAKAPLSYWLGLDPRAPLGDAAFRYVTLLGSALGLSALAGMSLLFATLTVLALSRLLPGDNPLDGPHAGTLLISALTVLRRVGGLLYFGAVHVPGAAGLVILAGSAIFALGSRRLMRHHLSGMVSLALCGFLFMAADFFASIYVGGLLP